MKIQTIKMDREKSLILHKVIGGLFLVVALFLLWDYFLHFLKITLALACIFAGVFFLVKDTRFRWFRIKRF